MLKDITIDLLDISLRAFSSIAVLFIITRFMGKKQISQLTFFDYVIGISIGSIAAELASTDEIPYQHALLAMVVYGVVAIFISFITNKSIAARRFFTGRTFLFIEKGKILEENLAKAKYDVNDLLAEARIAGYFDISDVSYALLETNGKISFLPTAQSTPPTLSDLNIQKQQQGLLASIIIDGVVMKENLHQIGLNEEWLKSQLSNGNYKNVENIILATVDTNNLLTVFEKTQKLVKRTVID